MNRAPLLSLLLACACAYLGASGCRRAEAVREGVGAATPAAQSAALVPDPSLVTRVLPNGVSYLARVSPGQGNAERVVLGLVVKAGSLVEADDEQGLAHFVEHMAFEGTTNFDRQGLQAFFARAGMALGVHTRAFTSPTNTRYLLEVPSDEAETLDRAVLLLRDWAAGIAFEPAAVERVRPVLLAEKRSNAGAAQRLGQKVLQRLLQGSRWAERTDPGGLESVIHAASAERLERFYRRWYQPQNLAVVALGSFDPAAMQRRVEQSFGTLPEAERPSVPASFEIPVSRTEHFLLESDPELSGTTYALTLKREARPPVTEEDVRQQLIDNLLVSMLQRRLDGLPHAAGAALTRAGVSLRLGEGSAYRALQLAAEVHPGHATGAVRQLVGELERAVRHGFLPAELERERPALELRTASLKGRSFEEHAVELMQNFLTGDVILATPAKIELFQRLLSSISLDELHQQAARWVQQSELHHVVLSRDAATLPSEAALRDAASQARQAPLEPYVMTAGSEPLMARLPTPGRIVHSKYMEAIDTHEWRLANGALVVFKATTDAPGQLQVSAFSPGGTARVPRSEWQALRLAPGMLAQVGLGAHDAVNTRRLLGEASIRIEPWISDVEEGIDASGSRERLEPLLQALHLTLSAPGRDEVAWAATKSRIRDRLEARRVNPGAALSNAITEQALVDPSGAGSPEPEAIEPLSLESLRTLYLKRLGDVGDFTFVFVGDASPAELAPLVAQYLASLPGTSRLETAAPSEAYYRPGVTRVRVRRGHEDKSRVTLIFHGSERLPSSVREDLSTLRGYLQLRLMERLRDDLGGVYAVQVWAKLLAPPRSGHEVVLELECRPDQCEALRQAALTVIRELAQSGATADRIDALRSQLERGVNVRTTKTAFWLEELGNAYRRQLDPAKIVSTHANGERISSAALQASARRYLRLDQYVDALLLPELAATKAR